MRTLRLNSIFIIFLKDISEAGHNVEFWVHAFAVALLHECRFQIFFLCYKGNPSHSRSPDSGAKYLLIQSSMQYWSCHLTECLHCIWVVKGTTFPIIKVQISVFYSLNFLFSEVENFIGNHRGLKNWRLPSIQIVTHFTLFSQASALFFLSSDHCYGIHLT